MKKKMNHHLAALFAITQTPCALSIMLQSVPPQLSVNSVVRSLTERIALKGVDMNELANNPLPNILIL